MEGWILERAETDLQFTGDISLPLEITALNTPYQFFKYLFTDDIFLYISQETNKYAVEKRPEKPSNITVKELEQFIVPKEQYMAVDEQIIPTKSRSSMRQYNLRNPQMGLQNFVLSGSSGFSFDFEIYTGAQGPVQSDTNLPKISTSSDVVVRLSRTIPEGLNYKLFFDNWRTLADSDPYLPLADFKCAVAEGLSQSINHQQVENEDGLLMNWKMLLKRRN
ncbi:hypothetical protein EVAR_24092_1 [Eumeta japonica]|uniref:PiggyBac transposable element-derived protein domain-containing protein n=1 Tax=Eumeta variegata TaxID=151549 RepID=A0A4C1ZT27_EUMVA|nr:hypothetical protein EVAR_24092_1 [Eumeta japonica]